MNSRKALGLAQASHDRDRERLTRVSRLEPRPLHPILRSLSVLLVMVLTLTGPVPQSAFAVGIDATGTVNVTDSDSGEVLLSNYSGLVTVQPSASGFTTGILTLGAGSLSTVSLGGLAFLQTADVNSSFNIAVAYGDGLPPLIMGTLGLSLPYGMSLTLGTVRLSANQQWTLTQDDVNTPTSGGATLGSTTSPVRVESSAQSTRTLTVETNGIGDSNNGTSPSEAFLDVGPYVNIQKTGAGRLTLLVTPFQSYSAFTGTLSIGAGTVEIFDAFMVGSGTGSAVTYPTLVFNDDRDTSIATLLISGPNAISNVSKATTNSGYGYIKSGFESGVLEFNIAAGTSVSLSNTLADNGDSNSTLAIRKTGAGYLELVPSTSIPSTFTGGLSLEAGILGLARGSAVSASGALASSPYGVGVVTISGGTLRVAASTGISLANALTFDVASNSSATSVAAIIDGTLASNLLTVNADVTVNANTVLTVNSPVKFASGLTGTANLIKTGTSTLTLTTASASAVDPINSGLVVIPSLTLRQGTLALNRGFDGPTDLIFDADSSTTTRQLTGGGSLTSAVSGLGNVALSADLSYAAFSATATTVDLSGASQTTVGGGSLGLATAGTVTLSINSGTLALGSLSPASTLPAALLKSGTGTLQLNGTSLTISGLGISGGTLRFSPSGALTFGGTFFSSGTSTVNVDSGSNVTLSGSVTGAAGFAKLGAGTLTLNGASTYNGTINVGAGTLALGGSATFGATSKIGFTTGGTGRLRLGGNSVALSLASTSDTTPLIENGSSSAAVLTLNGDTTYSGTFQDGIGGGSLSLVKSGTGTLAVTGTANTYTGSTTVSGGSLTAVAGALATTTSLVVSGGTLSIVDYKSSATLAISSGRASISGNGLTLSGAVSNANTTADSLLFSGTTGTITLSAGLTGVGSTRFASNADLGSALSSGSVTVGGSLTLGSLSAGVLTVGGVATLTSATGGTLNLNGSTSSIGTLSGASVVLGASDVVTVSSGTSSGVISGSGALTKAGTDTLTFTAANTYTGLTTVSAGTLAVTGNGIVAGAVANSGRLYFNSTNDRILSGALTGAGALEKAGSNTLTLSNASGFSGASTITAGTLAVNGLIGNGAIANNSTLSFISSSGTYSGTVSGTGVTLLSGTVGSPLTLTLGSGGSLGGTVKIGSYATLTIASGASFTGNVEVTGGTLNLGAANVFSVTSKLTITTGVVDLKGYSQSITDITLTGGTLKSTGASAVVTYDSLTQGATTQSGSVTLSQNSRVELITNGIRLTSGILGNLASGTLGAGTIASGTLVTGTYQFVEARASSTGSTLTFDKAVVATGSVTATVSGGSASAFALAVNAPVTTPLMDVQSGVSASFGANGTLATGTLQIEGDVSLSGNSKTFTNISLNGGSLRNGTAAFTALSASSGSLAATLTGSGDITKSGTGNLSISGASSAYAGTLRLTGGIVTLGDGAALGSVAKVSLESASGTLQLNGNSMTLSSLTGSGVVENGSNQPSILTLNPTSSAILAATLRDGSGGSYLSVVKAGSQALNVTVNQSYTGTTTVSAGSLVLGSGVSLNSTSSMEVTGGNLDLGGNSQALQMFRLSAGTVGGGTLLVDSVYTLTSGVVNAVLGGNGSLTKSGTGAVTLNTLSTYTGATTISVGSLSLGTGGRLGSAGSVTVSAGGFLDLGTSSQTLANVVLSGGAVSGGTISSSTGFNFDTGTANTVLNGSAKLTKSGTGAVTLGQVNAYSGGTELTAGILTAGVNGALPSGGTLTVGGGTLALGTTTQSAGAVVLTGGSLTGGTLNATGYSLSGGTISTVLGGGSAALAVSTGTVNLNTAATYGGGTTVNSGKLALGVSNALSSTGAVSLAGGELSLGTTSQTTGAFTLTGGSLTGGTLTGSSYTLQAGSVTSVLAGTGALVKQNSGTVVLSSANTFSGATTVSGGTLSATVTGALGSTSSIAVNGASLSAVDYNPSATLSLNSTGSATISGGSLSLAAITNADTAANSLYFSATNGTITLASLSGAGSTRFGSNARITSGGVTGGSLIVAGLLTSEISGGAVTAGSLSTGTLSGGVASVTGAASVTTVSNGSLTVGGVATLGSVSGGSLTLNGATSSIDTLNGGSIALGSSDKLTVLAGSTTGPINGGGSLIKSGSGTLTLGGAVALTGGTTVRAGTLAVSSTGSVAGALSLGDSTTAVTDVPTLLLNNVTNSSPITIGSGAASAYTATLGGSNTSGTSVFTGGVTLSAGSLNGVLLQAATGGTVDFQGVWTTNNKPVTVGSSGNAGTIKLSNALATTGSLNITNGSTVLAGTNNVFSTTTPVNITASTLDLGTFNTTAGVVNLVSGNITGGTLTGSLYTAQSGTISAVLAGTGAFSKTGTGTVTLSGANTSYTGTTTVASGGTLAFTGNGTVAGAIVDNGNLNFNTSVDRTLVGVISGTGSLVKDGATTLTLNATPTYTGKTTISAGTLSVTGLLASSLIQNDATLKLNLASSGTYTGTLSGSGTTQLTASAGAVTLSLGSGTVFGATTSTVQINSNVTLSLASNVQMFGNVILNGGILSANAANLSTDPSKLTITSGAVLLTVDSSVTPTTGIYDIQRGIAAVFTSTGSLSSGTLQIEGSVNLSGLSKSLGGISLLGGTLSTGTLSAGSIATTGGVVSTTLGAGFGDITKSGSSTLTVSGSSAAYAGTLHLSDGTTVLGSATALGAGKVAFEGAGVTPVLQMSGNNLSLSTLSIASGGAVIENTSATPSILTLNPSGALAYAGTLRNGVGAGSLAVTMSGTGSATLSGSLGYTGGTTVTAGTLVVGSVLPSGGNATVSGGALDLGGLAHTVGAVSLSGGSLKNGTLTGTSYAVQAGQADVILDGSATFTKTGSGRAVLSGANTLTGLMQVQGGTLAVSGNGKLSTGSLNVSGAASVELGATSQTVAAVTLTSGAINNGSLTGSSYALQSGVVGAALLGTADIVKTGAGTVVLSGANNDSGTTDVQGGTLQVSGSGRLTTGSLKVSGASTVDLGATSQTVGAVLLTTGSINNGTLAGSAFEVQSGVVGAVLAGSGAILNKTTTGTVTLNAANTYDGGTNLASGTLILAVNNALSNSGSLSVNAGVLSLGTTSQSVGTLNLVSGSIAGTGTLVATAFNLQSGAISAALSGSANLTKTTPGSVTLSGANALTGATSMQAGSIVLSGNGSIGTSALTLAGASTLDLGGKTQTVGTVTLTSGTIANGTLTGASFSLDTGVISAVLAGSGTLTQANGTTTLNAVNTFTGAATISSGTLILGNGQALANASSLAINGGSLKFGTGVVSGTLKALSGNLTLVNTDGTAVALTLNAAADNAYSNALSGSGSLVKTGAATLTLSGVNTYSGATTVSAGILVTTAGALANTASIEVNGATFQAVDTNSTATLSVNGSGTATVSGSDLSLAAVSNANTTANSVNFTASTGTITLAGLAGLGSTRFGSNARVNGAGISAGNVTAVGSLAANISGGSVSAANLSAGTLNGGTVNVSGVADVTTMSAGALALNGTAGTINTLNGGGIALATTATLTVRSGSSSGVISGSGSLVKAGTGNLSLTGANTYSGSTQVNAGSLATGSGALANTSAISVNGASLNAVNYNPTATLSVDATGTARVSGTNLTVGALSNANTAADSLVFSGATGTITAASLSGAGSTRFANNATITTGGISNGIVTVGGSLNADITGGVVSSAALTATTVSAGSVNVSGAANVTTISGGALTVGGVATLGTVSNGTLAFNGATASIATLNGGALTLGAANRLTVSAGSTSDLITGTGTLIKAGSGSLTLGTVPSTTVGISVTGGSLISGNLLSSARSVAVSSGATLSLSLGTNANFTGALSGSGTTLLSSSAGAVTLTLGGTATLDGYITLGNNVTLDLSGTTSNIFGPDAHLTLQSGARLLIGGTEQELLSLNIATGGQLVGSTTLSTGKILYGDLPSFVSQDNVVTDTSLVSGTVAFEVLTKTQLLSPGTLKVTAGRVGSGTANMTNLLLEPERATTRVRIDQAVSVGTGSVIAQVNSGSGVATGLVFIDNSVTAQLFQIGTGITATLTQNGTINAAIVDNGAFVVEVTGADKTISRVISGTGSLEKTGIGTATLSSVNSYSGATTLSSGVLVLGNAAGFGTGSVVFNGGGMRYGTGVTTDISSRIAALASGTFASVDTNGNNVTFASALTGAGGLTKSGLGNLLLTGSNTFSGSIAVNAGTLQIGASGTTGSIASDVTIASGAVLRFARSNSLGFSNAIGGAGTVEKTGAGTTTLSGNNTFTGGVVLNDGVLALGGSSALGTSGTLSFNGGTLQFSGTNAVDYSSRISTSAGQSVKIDTNGMAATFAAAFGASDTTLLKMGSGTLTLTADNLYTGATTIAAGTLELVGNQSGHSAVLLNGGNLQYTLSDAQVAAGTVTSSASTNVVFSVASGSATFNGLVTGAGLLQKSGAGSLNVSQSQTQTGGVTVGAGTLNLGTSVRIGGAINIASGAVLNASAGILDRAAILNIAGNLQLGNTTTFVNSINLSSTSTVTLSADVASNPDAFATLYAVTVTGTLAGGTNSTSQAFVGTFIQPANGPATIGGPLRGSVTGIPSGSILNLQSNGGYRVTLDDTMTLGSLTADSGVNLAITHAVNVTGAVAINGGTFTLSSSLSAGSIQFGGVSAVSGTLSGTASITATKSATSDGSINVLGGSNLTLSGSSSITASELSVKGGAIVTLNNPNALQNVGVIQIGTANSGTLTIAAGTLNLANNQILKGTGTINGSVNVASGSTLSPGNSPGTLAIGNLTVGSGGQLVLEHGKGTNVDHLTGTSLTFAAGSTLVVVDYDRSLLSGGTVYQPFLGVTTVTGTATNVEVRVRLGADTGTVGDTGVTYQTAASAAYSATVVSGTVTVNRSPLQSLGSFNGNVQKFAQAVNARQLSLASQSTFSVSAVDEIGTGTTRSLALSNLASQLAAANPSGYAELAGLSTQRTLNVNQGLVGHFASLRAGLIDAAEGEFNLWTTGYGTWQKQNGNASMGTAGYSGNSAGDLFGVEKRLGNLLLGVTGAGGHTSASFSNVSGSVSTDSWHGGAYATANVGHYVLESGAFYGGTDTTARRSINASGLTSRQGRLKVSGSEWLLHAGLARPLNASEKLTITPSARVIAQGQTLDGAQESDMGGLEVATARQKTYTVLHQVGVEARRKLTVASKPATASLQLDWIHDYNNKGKNLDMTLASDATTTAAFKGSDAGADAIRIGGAVEAALTRRSTLRLTLDYQAQSKAAVTNGAVSVGYAF